MNMKWFKTCALPAVLAAVVPIAAQAADQNFTAIESNSFNGGAVVIQPGTETTILGVGNGSTPAKGDNYIFGDAAKITLTGITSESAGIVSRDYAGNYTLGEMEITGTDGTITGFMLNNKDSSDASANLFSGIITTDKLIKVTNDGTGAGAEAYGARFLYSGGQQGISGTVKFGDMDISTNGTFAAGLVASEITGSVELGAVTVSAVNGSAWAVHINDGQGNGTGSLIVGPTKVTTKDQAIGVAFRNGGGQAGEWDSQLATTLGEVIATSVDGNATGVQGNDITGVKLTKDMIITADNGTSIGVGAASAVVAVDGVVNITADAGFKTTGNLGITLADENSSLETNLDSGGTLNFEGNDGKLILKENNQVAGNATINNTKMIVSKEAAQTTRFQGTDNKLTGTTEVILDVQNKEDRDDFNDALQNWGSWDSASLSKFVLGDGFTELAFDASGNLTLVQAESVNINDGFLAAYTIHNRYTTWNAVRDHMISGNGNRGGILGQECDPCADVVDCDPCDPRFNGFAGSIARNAWVNYVARSDEYRSSYQSRDWNLSTEGVQVGTDLYRTKHNQLGMLFGYEGGRMRNLGDLIKSEDIYVGVYGAHVFRNGWDVRGSFSYGWQDYDMTRSANTSSFKGRTSESTIEIGKRLGAGAWSLRPVFAVDVYNNNLKSAQETGANALTYADDSLTQVYLRSGTDLRYQARRFALNSGVYYSYDLHNQALSAAVSNVNFGSSTMVGSKLGRELLTFNLGADIAVAKNFSIFGGYQGQSLLDSDNDAFQSVGYIGANWKW